MFLMVAPLPRRNSTDWLFKIVIVTVLVMWVGAFAYSILNPLAGKEVLNVMSVGAPGLIGTLFGFKFRGADRD